MEDDREYSQRSRNEEGVLEAKQREQHLSLITDLRGQLAVCETRHVSGEKMREQAEQ